MLAAAASCLKGIPVDGGAAVTGEISVQGLVMPVGGVPRKVEAAKRAGTSVRTLRYYEEKGLIRPERHGENNYREYDEAAVQQIKMIRAYRELQFSLEETGKLLTASRMNNGDVQAIYNAIREQMAQDTKGGGRSSGGSDGGKDNDKGKSAAVLFRTICQGFIYMYFV